MREILTQIWIPWIYLILTNTLLYPVIVRNFPVYEHHVFCILIIGLISRSFLVGFSMLSTRKYYYRKGPVCCILKFYSNYCYGELSILFLLILSRDTPAYVHFLLLQIDLQQFCYFMMFYFKLLQCFAYLNFFESIPLWYFWTQYFAADKEIPNLQIFDHPQRSATTERCSTIGDRLITMRWILTQI